MSAACSSPKTVSPNLTAIASGKVLYQNDCASCHGTNGAGGTKVEDATSPDIRFAALNNMYKGNWSPVKRAILNGKDEDGDDLETAMPR